MGFFTKYFEYDGKPSRLVEDGDVIYSVYFGNIDTSPLKKLYGERSINTDYNAGRNKYINYGAKWNDSPLTLDVEIISDTPINVFGNQRSVAPTSYTITRGGETTDGRFDIETKGSLHYLQDWLFGSTEYKKLYAADSYDENKIQIGQNTIKQYVECIFINPEQIIHAGKVYGWKCQCVLAKPLSTTDDIVVEIPDSETDYDLFLDWEDGVSFYKLRAYSGLPGYDHRPSQWFLKDGTTFKRALDLTNYTSYYKATISSDGTISGYSAFSTQRELIDATTNIFVVGVGGNYTNLTSLILSDAAQNHIYILEDGVVVSYSDYIACGFDISIVSRIDADTYEMALNWENTSYFYHRTSGTGADNKFYPLDEKEYRLGVRRGVAVSNFNKIYVMTSIDESVTIYNWSDTESFVYPKITFDLTNTVSAPIAKEDSPSFAGLEDISVRTDLYKLFYTSNSLINIHNSSEDNERRKDMNIRGSCYGTTVTIDCQNCTVANSYILQLLPFSLTVSFDNSVSLQNQNYIRLLKGENLIQISGVYKNLKIVFNCERYLI